LATLAVCAFSRLLHWNERNTLNGRIVVLGTFFNVGWFRSHITPLARSGVREVFLVTDCFVEPCERVRQIIPPRWLQRIIGRAAAKALFVVLVALRYRPDVYMGYHIVPGAITALMIGKLFGSRVCYQMTGGPIEVIGGGYQNENLIMKGLGQGSAAVERLALAVIRNFDLVVVRGNKAKEYLQGHAVRAKVTIIPGSVASLAWRGYEERQYDMVFVGRLAEIKQPLQYVEIVAAVSKSIDNLKAIIIGDGPLLNEVRAHATALNVQNHLVAMGKQDNVEPFLVASRVFVLTSRSEGLSIAMAEAMAAGTVPVVANVGELGDLVVDGTSGWLITPNDINSYAAVIVRTLKDIELWGKLSRTAQEAAQRYNGVNAVAGRWAEEFDCAATSEKEAITRAKGA
jgi:glycosyltransferase involved in cell wall biosynthesis